MIVDINSALLLLQRALTARSLYAPEHPAVRASEEEAFDRFVPILKEHGDIQILVVNGRVIWDEQCLPASASLGRELFAALRRCGADQIRFQRGLARVEVGALLDALANGRSLNDVGGCPNLTFGHITVAEEEEQPDPGAELQPCVDLLRDLHTSISEEQTMDQQRLEEVLISVAKAATEHAGALLPLLETKRHDEYTFVHTTNVGILSGAMAEALNLDRRTSHDVMLAALLHDVGKRAISEELLNKKERLSDDEVAILRRHPVTGARMLCNTPDVPKLAIVVAYEHHIRADGGGYPVTPAGWKLNLASRIVQVADVFDALRTNRPYRKALPVSKIRTIMKNDVGTVFDATLLNVFFQQVLNRGVPGTEPVAETTQAAS